MTLNPIIDAKIEDFKEEYSLSGSKDEIFEKYVNYQLLCRKYPDFASDARLFDKMCVGGRDDMGLDGLIVSINDQPVSSVNEAKDIIDNRQKISIDIMFIQSKNHTSFEQKEFLVFKDGIQEFLKDSISLPANSAIREWHTILEEINKRENLKKWKKQPDIFIYYVTTGKWEQQPYIVSAINSLEEHIGLNKTYDKPHISCIDADHLIRIIDENEDDYVSTIKVDQKIGFPRVEGVDSSAVYLCKASNLMELLSTSDGNLRRNLFEDNVRDFQGYTNINNDVKNTAKDRPDQFLLLNNGVTIVCRKMNDPNMELVIEAPQIVNGCQTCNILYDCYREGIDLREVYIVLKVIASQDGDILNNVVKGTNRQNIVYEEALETTRDFHKRLEMFFASYTIENHPNLFYERRSKQFRNNIQVKVTQKVTLRMLTQSFVSVFLNRPDQGIHHELTLLKKFRTQLFQDSSSFYPYYTAAFIYKNLDNLFREDRLASNLRAFELHIAYIMRLIIMKNEQLPKFFNGKSIDEYCKKLLTRITVSDSFVEYARNACEEFEKITESWVKKKGENFRSGRKDSEEFTTFIDEFMKSNSESAVLIGKIKKIGYDKYGYLYGFIENEPENIFFHSANHNENVEYSYEGKNVIYEMGKDSNGDDTPINIHLLEHEE